MKKCPNCSKLNEETAAFCEECGYSLNDTNKETKVEETRAEEMRTEKIPEYEVPVTPAPVKEKEPMTPKQKGLLLAGVLLLLLLFGGYATAKNYYSREKQVDRYLEVLYTGDSEKIASILKSEDPNFKMDKDSIEPYATYLKENKEYMKQVTNQLKSEGHSQDEYEEVYLKQKGSYLLFFDKYDLMLNTIYAEIYTNTEKAILKQGEEEIGVADSANYTQSVGPLAPGKYVFSARSEDDLLPLENEVSVTLLNDSYHESIDLSLVGIEFDVSSNVGGAKVFFNDKEIGTLSEEGTGSFGPIAWQEDSTISLKKKYDFGELETEKEHFQEYDTTYYLDFDTLSQDTADSFFYALYNQVGYLTQYEDESDIENIKEVLVDGKENSLYKTFVNKGKEYRENEDISRVYYAADIKSVEQISENEYEVLYDLAVNTIYSYYSDKEDTEDVLPFKAIVVTEESKDEGANFIDTLRLKSSVLAE